MFRALLLFLFPQSQSQQLQAQHDERVGLAPLLSITLLVQDGECFEAVNLAIHNRQGVCFLPILKEG